MSMYETYNEFYPYVNSFQDLQGRILTKIVENGDEIFFYLTETHYVRIYHAQSCCESVSIEDISGDLNDLIGTPLLMVEESSESGNTDEDEYGSSTWTYYRFRTIKGSVDIRWYGSSNGYYSESVDIEIVKPEVSLAQW